MAEIFTNVARERLTKKRDLILEKIRAPYLDCKQIAVPLESKEIDTEVFGSDASMVA